MFENNSCFDIIKIFLNSKYALFIMNKKKGLFGVMFAFFLIKLLPLVSAYGFGSGSFDLRQGSDQVIRWVQDFATPFFEILIGDYSGGEFFFAKILILLLLFFVINFILKKVEMFENQSGVCFIIAAVVSILAVRFISENEFTSGILLPYGTLGVALSTILPFMLFFYFLHVTNMGSIGRRLGWIFFGITFIALWSTRFDSLSPTMNQIYGWTSFVIFLALIFDRKIHHYFAAHELSLFFRGANQKTIAGLQAEYLAILNVQSPQANARRHAIENQLRNLGATLP